MTSIPLTNGEEIVLKTIKKIDIKSISKTETKFIISLSKQQEFFPFLFDFLINIGFKKSFYLDYFFAISTNEQEDPVGSEYFKDPYIQRY